MKRKVSGIVLHFMFVVEFESRFGGLNISIDRINDYNFSKTDFFRFLENLKSYIDVILLQKVLRR